MKIYGLTFAIVSTFFFAGCLQTRSDVKTGEQRQVLQQQVGSLQKNNADTANHISDLEEQIRYLNGRVEVLENKLASSQNENDQLKKQASDLNQNQSQKMAIFQDALTKMEQNVTALQADVGGLHAQALAEQTRKDTEVEVKKKSDKSPFETGEAYFEKKEYRSAILEYEKYRNKFPKGKNFATATYKMGVSFQELGMKDEAKTFFDEVVTKHPKSEEAKKAKSRLQKLK
jgi:TolA-binding protein